MADDKGGAAGGTGDSASATGKPTAGADGAAGAGAGNSGDAGKGGDGAAGKGIISDGADKGNGADGKGKPDGTGAPEKYEPFKLPEGFASDEKATAAFSEWAKKAGLTQENAQAAVDMYASLLKEQATAMQTEFTTMRQEWYDESMKMLGKDPKAEIAFVMKARDGFFDKDAVDILRDSGLDNHPAIVRAFVKIGRAIADDTVVDGGKGGGEKSAAEVLYPNQGKK